MCSSSSSYSLTWLSALLRNINITTNTGVRIRSNILIVQNIAMVTCSSQSSITHLFTSINNHNDYSIIHAGMYANVPTTRLYMHVIPIWTLEICYKFLLILVPGPLFWTKSDHNCHWSSLLNQQRFTEHIIEINYSLSVPTFEPELTTESKSVHHISLGGLGC